MGRTLATLRVLGRVGDVVGSREETGQIDRCRLGRGTERIALSTGRWGSGWHGGWERQ